MSMNPASEYECSQFDSNSNVTDSSKKCTYPFWAFATSWPCMMYVLLRYFHLQIHFAKHQIRCFRCPSGVLWTSFKSFLLKFKMSLDQSTFQSWAGYFASAAKCQFPPEWSQDGKDCPALVTEWKLCSRCLCLVWCQRWNGGYLVARMQRQCAYARVVHPTFSKVGNQYAWIMMFDAIGHSMNKSGQTSLQGVWMRFLIM